MDDHTARHQRTALQLRAAGCVFADDEATLLIEAAVEAADGGDGDCGGDNGGDIGGGASARRIDALVARRTAGEPLEQIVGWAEFCDLRISVAPRVFVPRHRTELLCREAIALVRAASAAGARARSSRTTLPHPYPYPHPHAAVIVDLCCGSGAIGAAIAHAIPGVELHAADIASAAVECARTNLAAHAGTASIVHVHQGDLFEALPLRLRGQIDVLAANVPYVPTRDIATLPAEARDHEHRDSLDGGTDGLRVAGRVLTDAARWLAPGGAVLIEVTEQQSAALRAIAARCGLKARLIVDHDLDAMVLVAHSPARA